MGYYPVLLDLTGRRCVVIGGGSVGERKTQRLLESGARVKVISPRLTERLESWKREGRIQHVSREYQAGDLNGSQLAFAATDDPELNATIYTDAREQSVWINAADDPEHCDFILPAVVRRGDLTVAVSTGGASPAATRAIREELEEYLTDGFAQFVKIASRARWELREKSIQVSADDWNKALQGDFRRLIREGKAEEAKKLLLNKLGAKS